MKSFLEKGQQSFKALRDGCHNLRVTVGSANNECLESRKHTSNNGIF